MSKKKNIETLVYCGPSFAGRLQQFSIYKNGIPPYIDKEMEKCPSISKLFVPISKLAITREKLRNQGSKENQLYQNILKFQKEG
ncbi:hypothetical protein J2Z76_000447 [Sedimentibacter acidaminivorans]|uniref:Uncharacterized protein n=1 Tax=Sedimentibacter acidaminivorans TaxID=913099 RepID=A0ABS4GA99_9FIRM|nr:hypothetical protein [Sedimentibacter acidaminivorans]MBP1924594.1 hypothetical protein [Sedimentibacter acidaminivorans]